MDMQAHQAGCEAMGRGTGVPENLKALADVIDVGATPDSLLVAIGRVLLDYRSQNAAIEKFDNRYRAESLRSNALESELTDAREALAEWKCKAGEWKEEAGLADRMRKRAEAHCERFKAVALAVGASPIGDLPARVSAAYSACTDRGFAINQESE